MLSNFVSEPRVVVRMPGKTILRKDYSIGGGGDVLIAAEAGKRHYIVSFTATNNLEEGINDLPVLLLSLLTRLYGSGNTGFTLSPRGGRLHFRRSLSVPWFVGDLGEIINISLSAASSDAVTGSIEYYTE